MIEYKNNNRYRIDLFHITSYYRMCIRNIRTNRIAKNSPKLNKWSDIHTKEVTYNSKRFKKYVRIYKACFKTIHENVKDNIMRLSHIVFYPVPISRTKLTVNNRYIHRSRRKKINDDE